MRFKIQQKIQNGKLWDSRFNKNTKWKVLRFLIQQKIQNGKFEILDSTKKLQNGRIFFFADY